MAELRKHLTDANARELLDACVGKSFHDVELLIARRFPKADLADSIRRLPVSGPKRGSDDVAPKRQSIEGLPIAPCVDAMERRGVMVRGDRRLAVAGAGAGWHLLHLTLCRVALK